ncbi:APG12-domain-containing protein [Rhodotorula sp. JG-1b]|nr:APG12-domain-containing protein [Rhodotorula sp. JG-1b]
MSSLQPGVSRGASPALSSGAAATTTTKSKGPLTPREALEASQEKDMSKVVVRFKATGSAPIMKQNFYKITASNQFRTVTAFLRKELGWKPSDPLFVYINSAFAPALDDTVANLYKSFGTENHLLVNYSSTQAWG